jgi:hypothetical protein
VLSVNLVNEEAMAHWGRGGAVAPKTKKFFYINIYSKERSN